MTAPTFTDCENEVRVWLRGLALTGVGTRVFFDVPDGTPTYPLITVARIGGGAQRGEAPLEDPRLSFQVWAKTKLEAANAALDLANALREAQSVLLLEHTYAYGFEDITILWLPDATSGLPRYVVDCVLTSGPR